MLSPSQNQSLVDNLVRSGYDPSLNPQFGVGDTYTFIIDENEEAGDLKSKLKLKSLNTLYQFVKLNNFVCTDKTVKRIKVQTTRMDRAEEALQPLPHPSIPKLKKYEYARIKLRDVTL